MKNHKKNQTWNKRVKDVYRDIEQLRDFDELYNIVKRCGYESINKLWHENPLIGGSVNPADFGLANRPIVDCDQKTGEACD